jgi:hypothetical protein
MTIPVSAIRVLDRKEASANHRREVLLEEIRKLDSTLAEIRAAKGILSQANGHRPKLPKIIGNLRTTKKDLVFAAVRHRPRRGMTRRDIIDYIEAKYSVSVSPASVTTYLHMLSQDGLVGFDGGVWLPT